MCDRGCSGMKSVKIEWMWKNVNVKVMVVWWRKCRVYFKVSSVTVEVRELVAV